MIFSKVRGSTSVMVPVQLDNSTTGAGEAAMTNATSGLTCFYYRDGATSATAVTLVAAGTKGTWTNGCFQEIDATNAPGTYQIGAPNAAFASGADWVLFYVKSTGVKQAVTLVKLDGVDFENATTLGVTNLGATSARPGN